MSKEAKPDCSERHITKVQLPPFATEEDFERCKRAVAKLISEDMNLDEVTSEIMGISYATGGNYTEEIICKYAETYLRFIRERKIRESGLQE